MPLCIWYTNIGYNCSFKATRPCITGTHASSMSLDHLETHPQSPSKLETDRNHNTYRNGIWPSMGCPSTINRQTGACNAGRMWSTQMHCLRWTSSKDVRGGPYQCSNVINLHKSFCRLIFQQHFRYDLLLGNIPYTCCVFQLIPDQICEGISAKAHVIFSMDWRMDPGQTALHVMPVCAVSIATVFVNPATPCLAALYADLYGDATNACMDPVLMILPH